MRVLAHLVSLSTLACLHTTSLATSISVNFYERPLRYQILDPTTTAGITPVSHWNNLPGKSGTQSALKDSNGTLISCQLTWSAYTMWEDIQAKEDSTAAIGNAQLLSGYLDDSLQQPGPTIYLRNLPYKNYKVILYLSTDVNGDHYSSPQINSSPFFIKATKKRYDKASPLNNSNTITAENLSGTLSIKFPPRVGGIRSTLAGFQVIDTSPKTQPHTVLSFGTLKIALEQ